MARFPAQPRQPRIDPHDKVQALFRPPKRRSLPKYGSWSGGQSPGSASLPVKVLKLNESPKIIAFEAEQYVLTMRTQKEPIKLSWKVDTLSDSNVSRLRADTWNCSPIYHD